MVLQGGLFGLLRTLVLRDCLDRCHTFAEVGHLSRSKLEKRGSCADTSLISVKSVPLE